MNPIDTFTGRLIPLPIRNIDTDQIIPVRYVRTARTEPDYPSYFLHDLRFDSDGRQKEFITNRPPFNQAKIIVADVNWGCGSSRENAVYAMVANGIRSVIAPSIADIHYKCTNPETRRRYLLG